MKGNCPHCKKMQETFPDYCCLNCVILKAGLGDYTYKNKDGTTVIDINQKIIDQTRRKKTDENL